MRTSPSRRVDPRRRSRWPPPSAPRTAGRYKVVQTLRVGGDGGWDYLTVDPAARRLYVTRGTRVMVFDADTLAAVGEIPNTAGRARRGPRAGARSRLREQRQGVDVTIFDLKTLKPIEDVKVTGENPDAILYDPFSKQVFAFNGRTANATVLDAASGKVKATIAARRKARVRDDGPRGTGLRQHRGQERGRRRSTPARTRSPRAGRWRPARSPPGMAIDRAKGRLFVGCGNKMMAVVDAKNGKVVATVPIGDGVDANAFDPATGTAFSSNGEGTLTVAREGADGKLRRARTSRRMRGARTMALDEKTHRVFLATAEFGPPPSPTPEQPRPRPEHGPGQLHAPGRRAGALTDARLRDRARAWPR